jgi:hypothetical protein
MCHRFQSWYHQVGGQADVRFCSLGHQKSCQFGPLINGRPFVNIVSVGLLINGPDKGPAIYERLGLMSGPEHFIGLFSAIRGRMEQNCAIVPQLSENIPYSFVGPIQLAAFN